jgi:hypothetical protein
LAAHDAANNNDEMMSRCSTLLGEIATDSVRRQGILQIERVAEEHLRRGRLDRSQIDALMGAHDYAQRGRHHRHATRPLTPAEQSVRIITALQQIRPRSSKVQPKFFLKSGGWSEGGLHAKTPASFSSHHSTDRSDSRDIVISKIGSC